MSTGVDRAPAQFTRETDTRGAFQRQPSRFRAWVRADAGAEFPAEAGRYHLYVSLACPWAHRVIIARQLKGLEDVIGMTVVDPIRDSRGWAFTDEPDTVNGFHFLSEAYLGSDPGFEGRVTVPVLWDRTTSRIVNNESADILRMLSSEFDAWGDASVDLYPESLRADIDAINDRVYTTVNNGVYRAGFATTQEAHGEAVLTLFESLDWLESELSQRRYLVGDAPTEADWRLFTTLIRFDAVYHGHFKCNLRRLADYPALSRYLRRLYQYPGVAETVDFDHVKRHYYVTHRALNPTGIVPLGPELDYTIPREEP
ncbi:MAG: glutathione S-transferase family protein [Acidobacteriota bacterium]